MAVFCGISLVSLTIALSFSLLGYWLILPFAGLELGALATALYLSAVRADTREVISISGSMIAVQKGRRQPAETTWFQRGWAKVVVRRPRRRGHPTRLFIRCHGREVEIGGCLNEHERSRLADDLRRWITPPAITTAQVA